MTSTRYLQILLIITFTSEAVRLSCEPGEEFKSHNLTCDDLQNKDPFLLTKDGNSISTCTTNQTPPCDVSIGPYETSYMAPIITLNILNITRDSVGKYSCSDSANAVSECDFKIYAKPESVSCQVQQLQTNNVTVTCNVTKIYPSPTCQFYWYKNGTETSLPNSTITYQNISGQDQSKYFYKTCTLTQLAQSLGLGTHAFKLRAYPNVTGNTSDTNYGIDSSQTPNVTINYPIVQLESCTQGYVQEGSPANCSCKETANIFLSATTSFSQMSTVVSSGPGFTTYNFTANRTIGDLTCQATLLGWTSSPVIYKPLVAYGPKNVTVKVNNLSESGDISLCDKSQPVNVTVTCTVDVISPGVDFKFSINGSEMTANPANVSSRTYSVTNGGTLSVQCTGSNSALKEITATSPQQQIQVIEPPSAPPVIDKYQDSGSPVATADGSLTFQKGYNKIRCRAEGGYPPVSNVTVGCGEQTNTSVGNVAFLNVNVNRSMHRSECSCTAMHRSPCYRNNKTAIHLDVQFGPTILSFTLNENKTVLEKGNNLSIFCEAEGNPNLSLTLLKDKQQLNFSTDLQQTFNLSLMFNKTAECKDAGVYSCQAQAGQAAENDSREINVKCQQELENPDIQNKVYMVKANKPISISVAVIGYPEPYLNLTSDRALNKEEYNLTYTKKSPSYGIVFVQIHTLTNTMFQNYSLNITNSLGTLVYSFQIQDLAAQTTGNPPEDSHVGAIVGGVVGGILAIVLVVLIVIFLKRRGTFDRKKPAHSGTPLRNEDDSEVHPVVFDNTELYTSGRERDEVVFDNSDLYQSSQKPDEVVFDNKDLYYSGRTPVEVVFDNSDLYNFNRNADQGKNGHDSTYKSYSDVIPTITSASAMPRNTILNKPQASSSPYEDVNLNEPSSKNIVKPKPASKPKPIPKPRPGDVGNKGDLQIEKGNPADQVYATVVKVPKASKPFECEETSPPPSPQPEIPNKMFEKIDKDSINSMKKAGHSHETSAHSNNGFSDVEDDVNVYLNAAKC